MAATGAGVLSAASSFSPLRHGRLIHAQLQPKVSVAARESVPATVLQSSTTTNGGSHNGRLEKRSEATRVGQKYDSVAKSESESSSGLKDYYEQSIGMMRSNDGGPPRWFSPLECGAPSSDSPLLLFLPELVKLIERTVRSENHRSPSRPIYLVGESLGGCLALAVAARNPDIDLMLILANPATCFSKSQLQPILPFLEIMPEQLHFGMPYLLSLLTGAPLRMVTATVEKGLLPLQQTVGELSKAIIDLSSYLSILAEVLPGDTLLWKLQMLRSASAYANSRLHAVKARTLILSSGKDQLLPSQEEGERLRCILPKCEIRKFSDSNHAILLEDGVDLVTIIKGSSFYRRAKVLDYASDYFPPSPSEFKKIYESCRWIEVAIAPVMLSTLENGKIVKGLAGIPSKGPVLFVGYHMLLGLEVISLISRFWAERNILVRGIAHPMLFEGSNGTVDVSAYDTIRVMGAVPVSGSNLYKLLSLNSHVLLYPGGVREALHRKGEEYKLFWPERSEFVRMAARFGATIIPFGAVGEDDLAQVVFDYEDQMKIPFLKDELEKMREGIVPLSQKLYVEQILQVKRLNAAMCTRCGIRDQNRQSETIDKNPTMDTSLHMFQGDPEWFRRCCGSKQGLRKQNMTKGQLSKQRKQVGIFCHFLALAGLFAE
ncbi:hypothetical protein C3L33_19089, partial [Rhododendron williamsianum]